MNKEETAIKLLNDSLSMIDILTNDFYQKYVEGIDSQYINCIHYIPDKPENKDLINIITYHKNIVEICNHYLDRYA